MNEDVFIYLIFLGGVLVLTALVGLIVESYQQHKRRLKMHRLGELVLARREQRTLSSVPVEIPIVCENVGGLDVVIARAKEEE